MGNHKKIEDEEMMRGGQKNQPENLNYCNSREHHFVPRYEKTPNTANLIIQTNLTSFNDFKELMCNKKYLFDICEKCG